MKIRIISFRYAVPSPSDVAFAGLKELQVELFATRVKREHMQVF